VGGVSLVELVRQNQRTPPSIYLIIAYIWRNSLCGIRANNEMSTIQYAISQCVENILSLVLWRY